MGLHTCTAVARSLCVSWAFLLHLSLYVGVRTEVRMPPLKQILRVEWKLSQALEYARNGKMAWSIFPFYPFHLVQEAIVGEWWWAGMLWVCVEPTVWEHVLCLCIFLSFHCRHSACCSYFRHKLQTVLFHLYCVWAPTVKCLVVDSAVVITAAVKPAVGRSIIAVQ